MIHVRLLFWVRLRRMFGKGTAASGRNKEKIIIIT